jgi:DnaJ-class molecular chaperone
MRKYILRNNQDDNNATEFEGRNWGDAAYQALTELGYTLQLVHEEDAECPFCDGTGEEPGAPDDAVCNVCGGEGTLPIAKLDTFDEE